MLVCRVLGPLLRVLLRPGLSGGPQEHAVPKDQVHDIVHAGRTVSVGPLSLVAIALAARNVSDLPGSDCYKSCGGCSSCSLCISCSVKMGIHSTRDKYDLDTFGVRAARQRWCVARHTLTQRRWLRFRSLAPVEMAMSAAHSAFGSTSPLAAECVRLCLFVACRCCETCTRCYDTCSRRLSAADRFLGYISGSSDSVE